MPNCDKHPNRHATGSCRQCETDCCADCLVFSFGRLRRPYCVNCALEASGVQAPEPGALYRTNPWAEHR